MLAVVDEFQRRYYRGLKDNWPSISFLGINTVKCPLDLWLYQEHLVEARPDVIVETGTYRGGSALFLATICDLIGKGRIYTIDTIRYSPRPNHPRIGYIHGSSTNPGVVEAIKGQIKDGEKVLVILDSDHSKKHVLDEMRAYHSFVTPGSYMIVEDTNKHGYHLAGGLPEGGPMEALEEFMLENDDFEVDTSREDKFLMTFNPNGWLRRK